MWSGMYSGPSKYPQRNRGRKTDRSRYHAPHPHAAKNISGKQLQITPPVRCSPVPCGHVFVVHGGRKKRKKKPANFLICQFFSPATANDGSFLHRTIRLTYLPPKAHFLICQFVFLPPQCTAMVAPSRLPSHEEQSAAAAADGSATPSQGIPVVDLGVLINGAADERSRAIRDLGRACEDWGFFMVSWGISQNEHILNFVMSRLECERKKKVFSVYFGNELFQIRKFLRAV
jgi:hypothetical protein